MVQYFKIDNPRNVYNIFNKIDILMFFFVIFELLNSINSRLNLKVKELFSIYYFK